MHVTVDFSAEYKYCTIEPVFQKWFTGNNSVIIHFILFIFIFMISKINGKGNSLVKWLQLHVLNNNFLKTLYVNLVQRSLIMGEYMYLYLDIHVFVMRRKQNIC